jgi:transposase
VAEPEYTSLDLQLSDAELEQLPPSALRLIVRKLLTHIARQDQRIKELETEVSQLRARFDQNSSNSNKPPSSDSPYRENTPKLNKSKPGGRKGHKGHRQQLVPPTITEVVHPGPCSCGCHTFTELRPYHTHQHIELPEIVMTVIHFILYRGKCNACGKTGKGYIPEAFQTGFGPRLCALVAEIGGIDGNSRQAIQSFCSSVLGFNISLGAIQKIIDRASGAILPHYEAIRDKARSVAVNHVDET